MKKVRKVIALLVALFVFVGNVHANNPEKNEEKPERKATELETVDKNSVETNNQIKENVNQFSESFGLTPNRQFMQIVTKNGDIFYLFIDYLDKGQEVRLLTEVSDKDLISMAKDELKMEFKNEIKEKVENEKTIKTENETSQKNTKNEIKSKSSFTNLSFIIPILIFLISAGVTIYLFVKDKKKKANKIEDDYDIEDDEY